jgi:ABC-type dipeptide/oligopeptide/nickel transport system permease component
MRDYIIKRLLQMLPTVLMITLMVFAMMHAIPGDPIITLLGDAYRVSFCSSPSVLS